MTSRNTLAGAALAVLAACGMLAGCGDSAPSDTSEPDGPAADEPVTPLLQNREIADWCREHGVPESICTRCNDSLMAGYKEKGDWCGAHDLPESQCFTCSPSLEAEFKANAPDGAQVE